MRIDELSLQIPSGASRAGDTQRVQGGENDISQSVAGADGDRVDLSGLTGKIAQAMQSLSAAQNARVSGLQDAYRAGTYQPAPGRIAAAIAAF